MSNCLRIQILYSPCILLRAATKDIKQSALVLTKVSGKGRKDIALDSTKIQMVKQEKDSNSCLYLSRQDIGGGEIARLNSP